MNSIHLNICNIKSKIELSSNNFFSRIIRKRYQPFLVPLNDESVNISLSLKTVSNQFNNTLDNETLVWRFNDGWGIKGSGFDCKIFRQNGGFVGSGLSRSSIYTFDSLLRVLWTQLLLLRNGFLVHACGVCNGSESYLFPGKSGTGKTTLARKSPLTNVLSDELVGVQVQNKKSMLMGTPFWGEFRQGGLPVTQKIQGIYFLERGDFLRIVKISPQIAMTKLLQCTLFFSNEPAGIKRLLKLIVDCISNTPSYKIYLNKHISYEDIMEGINRRK